MFHNVNMLIEELQASELERKKLDQMKAEWILNISHDIKTGLLQSKGTLQKSTQSEEHKYGHLVRSTVIDTLNEIHYGNRSIHFHNSNSNSCFSTDFLQIFFLRINISLDST
ncbi:hypothetical protein [Paenibacillus sp. FSL R7-0652]|uniref:hypothetical protein n=1 Tax=Paenibacillus sp. FSL R7-0652 TaxID=2921687 RepID=UPI00315A29AA